jgi:hypothetical protein
LSLACTSLSVAAAGRKGTIGAIAAGNGYGNSMADGLAHGGHAGISPAAATVPGTVGEQHDPRERSGLK